MPSGDDLRTAWDANADDWVRWARDPELDHAFWRLNLPALLDLVPTPGELTVDIACGEGRVARALRERGHRVVGIEGSPALVAAARDADPAFEVELGDAASLPLPDGAADLAVMSLALMNLDDMPAAVREAARVLRPGGVLCVSLLHPLNTLGDAGPDAGYFDEARYAETLTRAGAEMTFHDTHRPLGAYFAALADAGFAVDRLVEPVPDDAYVRDHPDAARWRERPAFLHVRARLTGS